MFNRTNSPYVELFQAELELIWPNFAIQNQQFLDFLEPLKYYLKEESNLQAFSTAKYLEVPDSMAFWMELLAQSCFLYTHLHILDQKNLDMLLDKYPKIPEFTKTRFHLSRTFSLQQIQWLQTWVWQMHLKIITEMPDLKVVLQQTFWQKHLLSHTKFLTSFLEEKIILGDLLNQMGNGFGLFEIKIPVLVGFKLSLDLYAKLNLTEQDWHKCDLFLHQVSTVYSILNDPNNTLAQYLYYQKLPEDQQAVWWEQSEAMQAQVAMDELEVKSAINDIVNQFDQNLNNDLQNLNLPTEYTKFLNDLCLWIFKDYAKLEIE